jgi:hypothetical protein
MKKIC